MPAAKPLSTDSGKADMGKSTGIRIAIIRQAHRPGDHLGPCEICGKSADEQFVANLNTVYRTADGVAYLAAPSGGTYGHRGCLDAPYDHPFNATDWPRMRNLRVVPKAVLEAIAA